MKRLGTIIVKCAVIGTIVWATASATAVLFGYEPPASNVAVNAYLGYALATASVWVGRVR